MRLAIFLLAALMAALPTSAQVAVYPPEAADGGGGGIPTFPILAPCGAIGAPSYSFNGAGNGEMGMWCTATDPSGILVIQNRYDNAGATQPALEGRSRLSLGLEFWSLNAVRVEDDDYMSIQGFDEGGGFPKVRIDVTDDAVTGSYSFFEDRAEFTEKIRGAQLSTCTINEISYGFIGDTDTGLCSQSANRVGLYAGAGEKVRATDTQVFLSETGAGSNSASVDVQGFFPSAVMSMTDDVADLVLALQLLGSQDEGRLLGLDFTTGDETRLSFAKDYWDVGFDDAVPITDAVKSAWRIEPVSATEVIARLGEDVVLDFEGATDDTFETRVQAEDPLADNTVTIPDQSGRAWLTSTTVAILEEEFCNGGDSARRIGSLGWSNFDGSANEIPGVANHPCLYENDATASSGDTSAFYLANSTSNGAWIATDVRRTTYVFQVDDLASTIVQVGFFNDADTANITNGFYLEFDPALDAEFNTVTEAADTRTANATATTVATGTWYNATMIQLANGNWEFYLGVAGATPSLEFTHSTNLPTIALLPAFRVTKTTAADVAMTVDYWSVESVPLTR